MVVFLHTNRKFVKKVAFVDLTFAKCEKEEAKGDG